MSGKSTTASRSSRPARKHRGAGANRGLWLYGKHAVTAALNNPQRQVSRLLATPEAAAVLTKHSGAEVGAPAIEKVRGGELDGLLGPETVHQGVALETRPLPMPDWPTACAVWNDAATACVIVLDQVTDPRNVGAILRSAAVFGAAAVIMQNRRSPPESGALAKAASGALETVPLFRVTNLAQALDDLRKNGFWRMGLSSRGEQDIAVASEYTKCALVLGAEGRGLRQLTGEHCDFSVRLAPPPDDGAVVDSLNVSTAAAVALYAATRA